MKLFKKKCIHENIEIGRYYYEDAYSNCNIIHACIVYKCNKCGNVIKDWIYEKEFSGLNIVDNINNAVRTLKDNGFIEEIKYIMKLIDK